MSSVLLSRSEMRIAADVGVLRQLGALDRPDAHGLLGSGWNEHIEGSLGEMAFAKALGVYWAAPINTFKEGGDVGAFQVRTRSNDNYDLLVRPTDRDEDIFVLVVGQRGIYRVVGWLYGRECKRPEWLKTYGGRPPAYFVPQEALRPISTLKGEA